MAWSPRRYAHLRQLLSHGLTQRQIARSMGVSQQVISYQVKRVRSRYKTVGTQLDRSMVKRFWK